MDKNTIEMTESTVVSSATEIPGEERNIHRNYGLRITHYQRESIAAPRSKVHPRQFNFYSLCHLYRGKGWFWTPDGTKVEVNEGDGVLVSPGVVVDYGAIQDNWTEDYICFVGPIAEHLFNSGILNTGIIRIGKNRRLLPLIEQAIDPSDDAQIAANSLLQKLMVDLYLENQPIHLEGKDKTVAELRTRINQAAEQWWSVEDMARECKMSVNHLRTIFYKQTGMTPKNYVEKLKMMRAAEQLCSHHEPIAKVGLNFSYRDPYHFSRVFKRVLGISPQQYRNKHR